MKRTKHGFTLVELIIVIAVIGVLAAILIPTFSNVIDKANAKSALSDARNTVTQYLTDSFDMGLPENLVVIVKKANNYYLYGYNTTGEGSIQVSSGNPYRGLNDVTALMNKYSWNAKQDEMTPPDPNTEYTEVDTYGALYLVPYTGSTPDVPIKGFHAGKADLDMTKYPNLKDKMTEDMGDNTDVFHGILLPGQFTLDTGANGSGTGTGGSGGNGGSGGGTPEAPKYTVTFDKGSLAGDENAVVPAAQELSMFIPANWASQCTYTHSEDADEWYIFDHFEKDGTKIEAATPITEATTVTVVWKHMEATKYTLNFDKGTGDSMDLKGFTNGSEVRGDVSSIIKAATATKAHANFTGWKLDDEHVYTSDYAGAININANWTLTAQFDDINHTVTYKSGDGTGADIEEKLTDGSTVTLKTFASTGFTAPDGKVFYRWEVNGTEYAEGVDLPDAISGDITVTAKYRENKFTVEYLDGGKAGATLPETKKYTVGTASVTLEPATVAYYYVASYNTTLAGQSSIASNGTIDTSSCKAGDTVSVTPVWTEKTVTISYVAEGATAPAGTTQNANASYTVADEAAKSGYIFKHWTIATNKVAITGGATTVDANGTISFENPSSNTGATVTLTAVWEKNAAVPTDAKYYYGNTYREADGNLAYGTTLDGVPVNIINEKPSGGVITVSHTTGGGVTFNRTFAVTDTIKEINGTTYVKCNETTNWSSISGITTLGASNIKTLSTTGNIAAAEYVLTEDIDLSGFTWTSTSSGGSSYSFKANFDGAGYAVNGIKISSTSTAVGTGFFGKVAGSKIQNFMLPNATVSNTSATSDNGVGILVGVAGIAAGTTITNCHVSGSVTNSNNPYGCGGICGYAKYAIAVDGCSSTASITNNRSTTGGIVGKSATATTVANSWSQGLIICGSTAGGIASTAANITNCHSTCNIKSTGNIIGGIVGTSNGIIKNCWYDGYIYSSATSTTGGNIAGIAGQGSTSTKITDCWAAGSYFGSGVSVKKGLAGIYADSVGVSNSSGSYIVDRCISYAKLYNSQSNTYVYPISYASHAGTSGGNATACYFVNGSCFKGCKASVSADGSFTVTTKTVIAETSLCCTEYTAAYAYRGVASATAIKNAIQEAYTGGKAAAGPWDSSSYSSSGAWDISGTYPVLRSNPGSPS